MNFFEFFKELFFEFFFEFFLLVVCGGVEKDIKNTFAGPHTTHLTLLTFPANTDMRNYKLGNITRK